MAEKRNDLRIPFAEWLYRMSECAVPYQARALAIYSVAFKVTGNEELACLVGMDTKGVADKTYNKWKRYLSDNGWVIIKQITIGRQTTIEVCAAYQETPVTFTDVIPRHPRKFDGSSPVTITDVIAVENTTEPVKITAEDRNNYVPAVEITEPSHARIEPPSGVVIYNTNNKLASAAPVPERELAGLNGSADPMISDILGWMGSGTEVNARQWLSTFVQTHGQEHVRNSYLKLKTDILSGSLVAKPLQAWSKIAQRMKAEPAQRTGQAENGDAEAAKQAWQRKIIEEALQEKRK